ncbi:chemotaxis protein CheW [uncultured Desulfosarcina sp.]|uniref:hybrid sensor histidine kinase/response regulator n=1 Tax=uncultured Desulfosarcina sp. TaxID=218289 RepID=UPI0029C63AE5|nr:chemotaxis protein CheW [uncultured Desulfosarcina sp.]
MTIQDDETLQMYLEESIEHLADIETDLLGIEEAGADIDEDLVNKVYRAAHSIKGGAGFMGLTTIKDLTHEMENILGKIRSRDMVPTPAIINVLLSASDTLKDLMNDVFTSNDVDISRHIESLQAIAEGKMPEAAAPAEPETQAAPAPVSEAPEAEDETAPESEIAVKSDSGQIVIESGDGAISIAAERQQVEDLMNEGKFVYLAKIDLITDVVDKGKSPAVVIEEMEQTGVVVACTPSADEIRTMEIEKDQSVDPLTVLFATILKPEDINVLFEIPEHQIYQVLPDMGLQCLGSPPAEPEKVEEVSEPAPIEEVAVPAPPAVEPAAAEPVEPPPAVKPKPAVAAAPKETPPASDKKPPAKKPETETSLRVHVSLLDQLMTLAGELVLSRNQLLQSMSSEDHRGSEIAGQRIDLITSELQEAIMLTRMQSIGNVFNKFPRVVRDLSLSLKKKVDLHLEGKDVELDKTIIEAIGDPLTHLVRNAVDHGIELPNVRQQAGKNPVGKIVLKAYHEAGQVNIEIADDGKGLDGHVLTQKALEKGLISEDQAKVMSDKERTNLIFLPGFSTAEKITDVSGRGVGMDVVKTNLDKLGGIIDIDSELGKGSTIRIKLPLTLAIIPCQIVMTGNERYAIPQVNLEELLRIPADNVKDRIERVGDAEVVRLRGNLLPLIKLSEVIGTKSVFLDPETGKRKPDRRKSLSDRRSKESPLFGDEDTAKAAPKDGPQRSNERRYHANSALNIVVVSTGAMKYGLVVDELHDSEEIVVKPLGRDLKQCKGYAGATIMGDGRVALILDVANLAQMAGLTSLEGSDRASELAEENRRAILEQKDRQSLLVFRSAENEQFAAPLNMVERIEKIKATDIETVGGKRVIRYRGGSLPLFSVDEVAMVQPLADVEDLLVIVFIVAGRETGLLAIGPVDAIEFSLDVDGHTLKQAGIMGSAIINDHTTLMVDVYEIIQTLHPDWFEDMEAATDSSGEAAKILFAEDSNFFRNQVKSFMENEGYEVIEAEDGAIAWDLLQQHADEISLVVTDIEMPNMNGFELTRNIKSSNAYSHLPVIALTTLAGEEDIEKGRQVGISDYQIKLDREKLIRSIYGFLSQH